MDTQFCTKAPYVTADDGVVTVSSACGTTYNLTAEAAMRFSEDLLRGAARARGQTRMGEPSRPGRA